jgi:ABC-type proline/glycine betaine transport system substrate-binding protein
MAYVSQEKKANLAPTIKAIMKKFGVKGSLSIRNHSSLVLTVKSGKIDFVENYITTDANKPYANKMAADQVAYIRKNGYLDVNTYWIHEHYSGAAEKFLTEMKAAMEGPDFFNEDDIQSDYFSRSHYVDINIGKWDKPYEVTA